MATLVVAHGYGIIAALVTSFGYLHGPAPKADILVDVREHLRDPHVDPGFRQLNGHDPGVVKRVLEATPGANDLVDGLVAAVVALAPAARQSGRLIRVAIGCSGGRHRSVVIANAVAARVAMAGWATEAEHQHIELPVVDR